jgi:hypothetical protein
MTAVRMVYLDCDADDCSASTADDSTPSTTTEARERAHGLGWRLRNGKDICPSCATGRGPVSADGWPVR